MLSVRILLLLQLPTASKMVQAVEEAVQKQDLDMSHGTLNVEDLKEDNPNATNQNLAIIIHPKLTTPTATLPIASTLPAPTQAAVAATKNTLLREDRNGEASASSQLLCVQDVDSKTAFAVPDPRSIVVHHRFVVDNNMVETTIKLPQSTTTFIEVTKTSDAKDLNLDAAAGHRPIADKAKAQLTVKVAVVIILIHKEVAHVAVAQGAAAASEVTVGAVLPLTIRAGHLHLTDLRVETVVDVKGHLATLAPVDLVDMVLKAAAHSAQVTAPGATQDATQAAAHLAQLVALGATQDVLQAATQDVPQVVPQDVTQVATATGAAAPTAKEAGEKCLLTLDE